MKVRVKMKVVRQVKKKLHTSESRRHGRHLRLEVSLLRDCGLWGYRAHRRRRDHKRANCTRAAEWECLDGPLSRLLTRTGM